MAQKIDSRFVPIDSVNFWKENPWKHDDEVPKLAELLAINGQVSPIIVWRKNNIIYKGNHTKKALLYLKQHNLEISKKLKISTEEILKNIDPSFIKVEFRDFPSEEAAIAYGMSDNNSSRGGTYDGDLLLQLMKQNESYFTKERTGFTEKEMNAFRLSTKGNMNELEKIDLSGGDDQLGEFMIITFDNQEIVKRFKNAFSIPQSERKIDFNQLYGVLLNEWKEYIQPNIDGVPF